MIVAKWTRDDNFCSESIALKVLWKWHPQVLQTGLSSNLLEFGKPYKYYLFNESNIR